MSFTTSTVSTPSPLTALSRHPRQRRQSPSDLTSNFRKNTPSLLSSAEGAEKSSNLDYSDDEGAVQLAPQLSALARMLLSDFPEHDNALVGGAAPAPAGGNPAKRLSWSQSPTEKEYPTMPSGSSGSSSGKRTSPITSPESVEEELVTPAPGRHSRRKFNGAYTNLGSSGSSSNSAEATQDTENRYTGSIYGTAPRQAPGSVIGAPPPTTLSSSTRWKHAGRGLLGLAPRRIPRRDSDPREGDQAIHEGYGADNEAPKSSPNDDGRNRDNVISNGDSASAASRVDVTVEQQPMSTISRRSRRSSPESFEAQQQSRLSLYTHLENPENKGFSGRSAPQIGEAQQSSDSASGSSMSRGATIAEAPSAVSSSTTTTSNVKENMPLPRFRRTSAAPLNPNRRYTQVEENPAPYTSPSKGQKNNSLVASPEKKNALFSKSNNAPLRPAPPPPKMSLLETVTASAGASVTSTSQTSRKQRSTVYINRRPYRRIEAIGKGGSSKVYKVEAANSKMLAMKKVTFNVHDGEAAIRGYKGEIELLNKLSGVDRVIRLYDWEINDEKQTLTMLMECGETDLAKVLTLRHGLEESVLDLAFTHYYWREMLLCVQSVHALNIIHSDLKPANFLLVQGSLKLIDFGIANAIQDDTVNVHRESQVGTLNYMSPEAIVDINASSGKAMASVGAPRLMKLGAPSDVWSLGCILYQMTYGKTPFSHLTSMYQKITAIPDPNHPIEYPSAGIGGVPVPESLINIIKRCLARDKNERPTIEWLLRHPFLIPGLPREDFGIPREDFGIPREEVEISKQVLKLLLYNTLDYCAGKGVPSRDVADTWADDVFGKLEQRMHERPTIEWLLSNPFLNPDLPREEVGLSKQVLKLLLYNTLDYCADKGVPSRDVADAWADDVFGKLEKRMRERLGRGS
ncbi:hypothetical protein RUND412_003099 [Rhizina undulata]